jgi:hypothetical protein
MSGPSEVNGTSIASHLITEKERHVTNRCVAALRDLPFPVAMCLMANILVRACMAMGVERHSVIKLVSQVWDGVEADAAQGVKG